jgi:carbamoyl-phosphate synthase small subunit
VPPDDPDEWGLSQHFESERIHVTALIVADYSPTPSHWRSKQTLAQWLRAHNIPAIFGVDTRALAQLLRDRGSTLGKIEFLPGTAAATAAAAAAAAAAGPDASAVAVWNDPNTRNLVAEVSRRTPLVLNPSGSPRLLVVDMGMKHSLAKLLLRRGAALTIVPWDYDIAAAARSGQFDGVFLSNGPGDPALVTTPAAHLRTLLADPDFAVPVFGVCMGCQVLALAAGARTVKMRFGNRGMNQPVLDLRTSLCYITSQNHGYAVDAASLPADQWTELFRNANDDSCEGFAHRSRAVSAVQFHPEARAGPLDTEFLFDDFLACVADRRTRLLTLMLPPRQPAVRKLLLLGSGGLSIGQAGEFDYSGSQAIKAFKEEGVSVVLVNPNIATVQTGHGLADAVYFDPVTPAFVEAVIAKERPDAIVLQFGGQTALNCGLALEDSGVLRRYGVRVLGTPTATIRATEDRELFAQRLAEISERAAPAATATTVAEGLRVGAQLGFPVLVRSAYSLGGLGSGFADGPDALRVLLERALVSSPQVVVDKSLRGWKEVEYEVVRDCKGNCVAVCNMENFDPLGIHTGDSIVVAPSQTLSNEDYFRLRAAALRIVHHLGVVGECNVQFAADPRSDEYCVIEVNARLSRSSALASKATGYPLAYVAAKLALGRALTDVKNKMTQVTAACFEPALDYVVVKIPRWDTRKFSKVSSLIGSAMKSVGEVMAIGRTFEEAFQKAMRMVDDSVDGFSPSGPAAAFLAAPAAELESELRTPSDRRLFALVAALHRGYTVQQIADITDIDTWFLAKLRRIVAVETALARLQPVTRAELLPAAALRRAKQAGFSDRQLARILAPIVGSVTTVGDPDTTHTGTGTKNGGGALTEACVRAARLALGIIPVVKQVDTLAAEIPARSNYLYMTYNGSVSDVTATTGAGAGAGAGGRRSPDLRPQVHGHGHKRRPSHGAAASLTPGEQGSPPLRAAKPAHGPRSPAPSRLAPSQIGVSALGATGTGVAAAAAADGSVIVLGCGAYRIGSSCEFDWCAVSCVRALRAAGTRAVVINYNPETVSTDYDESDRLYFEELSLERVLDVYAAERARGVVVSVGGQIPNNLAGPLTAAGACLLGTPAAMIDAAENRARFSALLDELGVEQPVWRRLDDLPSTLAFARSVGFPVLVRPSYVLSGAAMNVARSEDDLLRYLDQATGLARALPVVVSKFIQNAKEIEYDGVAADGAILNYAISEHIENAGVHSGDATLVLPAQKLYAETLKRVRRTAALIARRLCVTGPFNLQFMARDNDVLVIECNLRASRSFPFVSKTFNLDLIALATRAMLRLPVKPAEIRLLDVDHVCVKAPVFSFARLEGADPVLRVEMSSTGEVAAFGADVTEAYMTALLATNFRIPPRGCAVLLSTGPLESKLDFLGPARTLHGLGYRLLGTAGTALFFTEQGVPVERVDKPSEQRSDSGTGSGSSGFNDGGAPGVLDAIRSGAVGLVINVPSSDEAVEVTNGYRIRRAAVDFGVPLVTNVKTATLLVDALARRAAAAGAAPRPGATGAAVVIGVAGDPLPTVRSWAEVMAGSGMIDLTL